MPIHVVCDGCRAEYQIKEEHAGRKVKCKTCATIIVVPQDNGEMAEDWRGDGDLEPAFRRDKFLVNQKRISISEKYYVFDEAQNPIMFVVRPAHVLKNILALFAFIVVLLVG